MVKLKWFNGDVPKNLKVRQVYGIIFMPDGRIMLRVEGTKENPVYSLAGGTPESFDANMEATLKREIIEEVNTTIFNPLMVGYQLVDEQNGKPPYAQARMVAIINEIGEPKPDPDGGETYLRLLTTPNRAIQLLNWGNIGKLMIEQAFKIAKQYLNLKVTSSKEEYV